MWDGSSGACPGGTSSAQLAPSTATATSSNESGRGTGGTLVVGVDDSPVDVGPLVADRLQRPAARRAGADAVGRVVGVAVEHPLDARSQRLGAARLDEQAAVLVDQL